MAAKKRAKKGVGAVPVELTFRVISKTSFGLDGESGKQCAGGIIPITPSTRLCPPRLVASNIDFEKSTFNLQLVKPRG